jgi:hypothetical protein
MIENSLSDGALYPYRDPNTGRGDAERMLEILKAYWMAASEVFAEGWGLPARKSRLMHGVGIVSLGFVMDAIADRFDEDGIPTDRFFADDLELIAPVCRWTSGEWDFGGGVRRKWNELQNLEKDIQLAANLLLRHYRTEKMALLRAES